MEREKIARILTQRGYKLKPETRTAGDFDAFLADLQQLFCFYFPQQYITENFALPADFAQYLIESEGAWYQRDWAYIGSLSDVLSLTADFMRTFDDDFFERKQAKTPFSTDTMWLKIGEWSDKHDWIICVDKQNLKFGQVIDAYDDHPFLNEDFLTNGEYPSFEDFIGDKYTA